MLQRTYDPTSVDTDEHRSAVSRLSFSLRSLFRGEAPKDISRQVRRHMERHGELSPVTAHAVLQEIQFPAWEGLVRPAREALDSVARASGMIALDRVGVEPAAAERARIRQYAETFARTRAAEMIGMRLDAGGKLVANPNSEYAITESTRDMIRDIVRTAVRDDWGADRLTEELKRSHAFSPERAEMIARSELATAHHKGVFVAYRTSGLITGKRWITMHDNRVEEVCRNNESAGIIEIGSMFPSGHTHPLAHPRCRCKIAAVR